MRRGPGEAGLVRALGVWGLAASIVNITIGGGIFVAPGVPDIAGRLGAAAPVAYIVCAIAMAFVVLCFAEAGSRVALTGGPYAYVERAFGGFAGFAVGWMLWVTATIATAAVGTIFADGVQRLFPAHPLSNRTTVLALVFGTVAVINVFGVRAGSRLNVASTIAKLIPLAILIVIALPHVQRANLRWTSVPTPQAVGRASITLIFIFAGIESALVPSGEVREPARSVPRAVMLALVTVTLVYMLIQLIAQGVLGASLSGRPTPLVDVADAVMGPAGAALLGVAVVLSTFGYLCGMILAAPRALFAFARDGVLPLTLSNVHERYHTPWIAIIVQTALCLTLAISTGFQPLVILANVSVLFVYFGCAAAAWQLRRRGIRDDTSAPLTALPGSRYAPALAMLIIIALLLPVTRREWLVAGTCLAIGIVLYIISLLPTRGMRRAPLLTRRP
ncbi:MAG TPA: APC family permease [Gemmatimonadaceae bacterium]|nr:APC family permease [Gemmatimonadaceae bacterium]